MMAPAHVLFGLLVGLGVSGGAVDQGILAAAVTGSLVPDFDFLLKHRKSLHFPIYGTILGCLITVNGLIFELYVLIVIGTALLCVGVHSVLDIFGGVLGLRPWEKDSGNLVYNHYEDSWISNSDISFGVGYDGSPLDLLVTTVISFTLILSYSNTTLRAFVLLLLLIGCLYSVLRKRLVQAVLILVNYTPKPVIESSQLLEDLREEAKSSEKATEE